MYYRYFGLKEEPFSIAVNPRYLFMSARHRDALAHLLYGVGAGGGFVLLTGEVGTGKTTINRCLLEQLPADTDIAIILNPALNAEELLATACDEFGISYDADTATLKSLTDTLHRFLLDNHQKGRNTVLLIDEAQHLQFDVLEQIRLLTNLETNTRKLLQIILVGQPELAEMLARPELRQLSQRITARYELTPLSLQETHAYIRHRLQVAGLPGNQELFPAGVVKEIYRSTGGIPRLINVLCDRLLLGTFGQNQPRVSRDMLRQAVKEVMGELPARRRGWTGWPAALAFTLVLTALAGLGLWVASGRSGADAAPQPAAAVEDTMASLLVADRDEALALLAGHLGLLVPAADTCQALRESGWRCEALGASSWQDLLAYNRPAVLTLVTPDRFLTHAVLVGLQGDRALLATASGTETVALARLGSLWRGDFELLWQPPVDYAGPLGVGDRGPLVRWLADAFAELDGQARPLADTEFNEALQTRVRLFQRRYGLEQDGVVGLKTLLRLEVVRGAAVPLQAEQADLASLGSR
ncbi:MAG: AAA family ATPase [Halieaceae bacterium]|jgi:general secretion pathway protein A|nr:AAA family ATPase [Halieaceae bacterium]